MLRKAYDRILEKDDWKERFKVLSNLMINLHDAAKPEIFEHGWHNEKYSPIAYINGLLCNQIDDEKLRRAKQKMASALDSSVSANLEEPQAEYGIVRDEEGYKAIDLSKIDTDKLRRIFKTAPYKAFEIENLREFIEKALAQMINKNATRIAFSERYKKIIDNYNAGGKENNEYYEKLLQFLSELQREDLRASNMGLEEEELEIFDLLTSGRKLTKHEEQKVILASKNLYRKLMTEKKKAMVMDWYKDEQPRQIVMSVIQKSLNADLPECYDRTSFRDKTNLLFNHFVDMAVQGYGWTA